MKHLRNSKEGIAAATAILFLLLVYAPIEIYVSNVEGFTHDLYDLLRIMLPCFAAALLLTWTGITVMNHLIPKFYHALVIMMFAVLLALYCQGTFFSGKLPPLNGSEIDWSEYDGQRIVSVVLWGTAVAVSFILSRVPGKELFNKIILGVSVLLTAVLVLSAVLISLPGDGLKNKKDMLVTDSHILELSDSDTNLVIILLDQIGGEDADTIISEDTEYEDIFKDFTFFRNTVGSYPFTQHAVPYILTGQWYENNGSFYTYQDRAFEASPLFTYLLERDFRIGVYDEDIPTAETASGDFENTVSYDAKQFNAPVEFVKTQLKLIGLKYFPYDLKKFCIVSPDFLYANSRKVCDVSEEDLYDWSNLSFYRTVQNGTVEYSKEKCFRFIHISGAHDPFIYDKDMNIIEGGNYTECIKASFTCVKAYIDFLKKTGCYDNTVIIVMSDHGYFTDTRHVPLLMVKGLGEDHDFTVSDIPVSHADLQDAYKSLIEGATAVQAFPFTEDQSRERRFLSYSYAVEDHMSEYIQYGYATDQETFKATGITYDREGKYITRDSFS